MCVRQAKAGGKLPTLEPQTTPEVQLSHPLSRLACSPEAWGSPWGCCNGGAAVKKSYSEQG